MLIDTDNSRTKDLGLHDCGGLDQSPTRSIQIGNGRARALDSKLRSESQFRIPFLRAQPAACPQDEPLDLATDDLLVPTVEEAAEVSLTATAVRFHTGIFHTQILGRTSVGFTIFSLATKTLP